MKTYVFIGGLTEEQALKKLKKYYPEYNEKYHKYALGNYFNKASVCHDDDGFCHCYEEWYIENGYTRLDKEEVMNKYYKIETYSTFFIVNPVFRGKTIEAKEYLDKQENYIYPGTYGAWDTNKIKSIEEITEEEYNKIKNPTVNVSLNIDYSAVISKDGIKVGCQNFTHEAIQNLSKELEKFLDKQ